MKRGRPIVVVLSLGLAATLLPGGLLAPFTARAAKPSVVQLAPITYMAFDGHTETLVPWQGSKVTVLVQQGVTRSAAVMTDLVTTLDKAWTYDAHTVGRLP